MPQGFKVTDAKMVKPGIYPYTEEEDDEGNMVKSYTHSLPHAIYDNGDLRVAGYSNINEDLTATSGNLFRVFVAVSPYTKPGEHTITMTGLNLTANDGKTTQKYVPEGDLNTGTVTVGTAAQVSVAVAANSYTTVILPFAISASALPDGLVAYKPVYIGEGLLKIAPIDMLSAYTPYILKAPEGYSGTSTISGTIDPSSYPTSDTVEYNGISGLLFGGEVSEGFVFSADGLSMERLSTATSLGDGGCYLSYATALEQSYTTLSIVEMPKGTSIIDEIAAETPASAPLYDLSGRRVATPTPGQIYISNNRKIIINK